MMGIFGCFGGSPGTPRPPQLVQAPADQGQRETPKPLDCGNIVQLLHISGQQASVSDAAFIVSRSGSLANGHADVTPQIVCLLRSTPSGRSSSSLHIPAPIHLNNAQQAEFSHPWLYAQPVAANEAACKAMGATDLEALAQALADLLAADASMQSLSEVALSVAAPRSLLQPTPPYLTSRSSKVAGCYPLKVSSCYIRHQEDCTLSPALVLEFLGTLPAFKLPAVVHMPAPHVSDPEPETRCNTEALVKQPAEPSTTVLELVSGAGAEACEAGAPGSLNALLAGCLSGRDEQQDQLLRARSMLSAMPCIATLLELNPSSSGSPPRSHDGSQGASACGYEPLLGRVLLQNEASLAYWGKLGCDENTGARNMLTALFKEPDAIQELMRHLEEQQGLLESGHLSLDTSWKKVVQVPEPRSLSRRANEAEKRSMAVSSVSAHSRELDAAVRPPVAGAPLAQATPLPTHQSHTRSTSGRPSALDTSVRLSSFPSPASQPIVFAPSSRIQLCLLGRPSGHRAETGNSSSPQTLELLIREGSCSTSQCSGDMDDLTPYDASVDPYDHHDEASPRTGGAELQASCGPSSLQMQKLHSPFRRTSQPILLIDPPADRTHGATLSRLNSSSASRTSLSFPQVSCETVTPSVTNRVMMLSLLAAAGSGGPASGVSSSADLRQRSQLELGLQQASTSLSGTGRRIASMDCVGCVDTLPHGPKGKKHPVSSIITPVRQQSGGPTLLSKASGPEKCSRLSGSSSRGPLEEGGTKQHLSLPSSPGESPFPSAPQLEMDGLVVELRGPETRLWSNEEHLGQLHPQPGPVGAQATETGGGEQAASWGQPSGNQQIIAGTKAPPNCSYSDLPGMEELKAAREEEEADGPAAATHEVQAFIVVDPVCGSPALLILQTDITARALMEKRMSALTETQLTMLENMLPRQVLEYAIRGAGPIGSLAFQHEQVTVLFMDIVGFTSMSKEVQPHLVMEFLNRLFSTLDDLCEAFDVYKVDTAGDSYIVAGALMTVDEAGFFALDEEADPRQGAKNVVEFAEEIMHLMETIPMPHDGRPTTVRIGIHTGSVVSGVVGTKMFKFSLFGDTMNTSSRMESTSRPGCIQVSKATFEILDEDQQRMFKPTGGVEVKGKGLMATYCYVPESLKTMPSLRLRAINEEWHSEHLQSPAQGAMSASSAGISNAPLLRRNPRAGGSVSPPDSLAELHQAPAGKARRFSTQSNCPCPAPTTATAVSSSAQSTPARTRRSYCASYAEGTARRPDHVFADMFLAAAAAMVQQPQQQQDGARLKLLKSNVKLLQSHETIL